MRVLLHICCAPCEIFPLKEIRDEGHSLIGFFYNPNIHPYSEYLKRKLEVEKYSKESSLKVIYSDYDVEDYFQHIVYNESITDRCQICWWLRLEKTACFAKENAFDAFTTTLLVSPYQDQDGLKNIGEEIAKRIGIIFYYKDFRPGFKASHDMAKTKGIYCQNYCGCLFSEKERIERVSLLRQRHRSRSQ